MNIKRWYETLHVLTHGWGEWSQALAKQPNETLALIGAPASNARAIVTCIDTDGTLRLAPGLNPDPKRDLWAHAAAQWDGMETMLASTMSIVGEIALVIVEPSPLERHEETLITPPGSSHHNSWSLLRTQHREEVIAPAIGKANSVRVVAHIEQISNEPGNAQALARIGCRTAWIRGDHSLAALLALEGNEAPAKDTATRTALTRLTARGIVGLGATKKVPDKALWNSCAISDKAAEAIIEETFLTVSGKNTKVAAKVRAEARTFGLKDRRRQKLEVRVETRNAPIGDPKVGDIATATLEVGKDTWRISWRNESTKASGVTAIRGKMQGGSLPEEAKRLLKRTLCTIAAKQWQQQEREHR